MSKRSKSSERATQSEAAEVLTNEEQDAIIQELQTQMNSQNKGIKLIFSVICYFVAAIYSFCLVSFYYEPWSLVHQQRFEYIVSPPVLLLYYGSSCAVFITAARWKRSFGTAITTVAVLISLCVMIGWMYTFYIAHVQNIALYWLPFSDIGILLVAFYIDANIDSTAQEMSNLERKRYDHKAV